MIKIIRGSILDFKGDAIVNPANSFLDHKGGLARVIADAAYLPGLHEADEEGLYDAFAANPKGESFARECLAVALVPTGGAVTTSAGNLPYKGIIHAVGPVWGGGGFYEADLLEMAYESVFREAHAHGWTDIALPAVSCGIFGFPIEDGARIALEVASWYQDDDEMNATFYLFEDEHYKTFNRIWFEEVC